MLARSEITTINYAGITLDAFAMLKINEVTIDTEYQVAITTGGGASHRYNAISTGPQIIQ